MPRTSNGKVIFHVDIDAFYASVEQLDHPEYRGLPVIVGASPGKRGVVSACSYEARRYGIHSAMPISEAYRLCREGIFLPVNMKRYQEVSSKVMSLFDSFTPDKTQISIDEAFLDMSGTENLFGQPEEAAEKLKMMIKTETGLTVSIGISHNRLLAKIASDFDKPDGLVIVRKGEELEFLDKISLKDIWGIGRKTLEVLNSYNITTVRQLREAGLPSLQKIAGKSGGTFLYNAARGIDPGIYSSEVKNRSISSETTFNHDTSDPEIIRQMLLDLSVQIMFRLRESRKSSRTVFIKIRYSDFRTLTSRHTIKSPFRSHMELFNTAVELFSNKWDGKSQLRLIGLGVASVDDTGISDQIHLFNDGEDRKAKVEEAVQNLMAKGSRITKASLLGKKTRL